MTKLVHELRLTSVNYFLPHTQCSYNGSNSNSHTLNLLLYGCKHNENKIEKKRMAKRARVFDTMQSI